MLEELGLIQGINDGVLEGGLASVNRGPKPWHVTWVFIKWEHKCPQKPCGPEELKWPMYVRPRKRLGSPAAVI